MSRRFVIEAVMIAIYGQMLSPGRPVEYLIPYSSILELYEMKESVEPVMPEPEDDLHAKRKIGELIAFFEEPLNKKKIERSLTMPWRKSPPMLVGEEISFTVVNSSENAQYGELFDPIETEVILTSLREQVPVLTDQIEFTDRVIETEIPIQVFDVEDFEFALEAELRPEDWMTH